ncbi:MAG: rubrerythrin [Deltaproteobacteria bacterium]|nr:rubrerythrin [Deltaproteobacteria bacterium]
MTDMVRCRACGYIAKESSIKKVCPACGLPETVFEPYQDKISKNRQLILGLNLHPISVHFPQALAILIPIMLAASWLPIENLSFQLLISARLLIVILPFSVVGALLAGLIDGKTRFKKLTTPYLLKKIIVGSVFLILSTVMAILMFVEDFEPDSFYLVFAMSVGCAICAVILGKIGGKIVSAKVNG